MPITFKKDLFQGTQLSRGVLDPRYNRATRVWLAEGTTDSHSQLKAVVDAVIADGDSAHNEAALPLSRVTVRPRSSTTAWCFLEYGLPQFGGNQTSLNIASMRTRFIDQIWYAKDYPEPIPQQATTKDTFTSGEFETDYFKSVDGTPVGQIIRSMAIDIIIPVLRDSTCYTAGVLAMIGKVNNANFAIGGRTFGPYTLLFGPVDQDVYTVGGDTRFSCVYRYSVLEDGWYTSYHIKQGDNTYKIYKRVAYPDVTFTVPPLSNV